MTEALPPHWEQGYRCHGLWRGTERLGYVSLGPLRRWDCIYRWGVDADKSAPPGEAKTLRSAKLAVERALGLLPAGRLNREACGSRP